MVEAFYPLAILITTERDDTLYKTQKWHVYSINGTKRETDALTCVLINWSISKNAPEAHMLIASGTTTSWNE